MTTITEAQHDQIRQIKKISRDKELHWLVELVVQPELPQLIETLQMCSNMLLYNTPQKPDSSKHTEKGPAVTLPVSSSNLEAIKGILVRDGAYITKMSVAVKEKHFNKVVNYIKLSKPIPLIQIKAATKAIELSVMLIVQAQSVFDENLTEQCQETHLVKHALLLELFHSLLEELQVAKKALQLPTDPKLVFPLHITPSSHFEPPLDPHIALDLYISQAEVCLDLKDLFVVTEKPWCDIDPDTGKSYVDKVRDRMSEGKSEDLQITPKEKEKEKESMFSNVLGHLLLRPKLEAQDYITRCITYNNQVVIVDKKLEVSSADPILVSAFTKLDSVGYVVSRFMDNIKKLM